MLRRHPGCGVLGALYFGIVAGLSFVPGLTAARPGWIWMIAAFVPVGVLLAFGFGPGRWWVALGFGGLGAAWIEAGQSIWMPEYANLDQVLSATAGVGLGVAIVTLLAAARAADGRSSTGRAAVPAGRRR
jgi:hypothetical protein